MRSWITLTGVHTPSSFDGSWRIVVLSTCGIGHVTEKVGAVKHTLGLGAGFLFLLRRDVLAFSMLSSRHFDKACIYRVVSTVKSLDLSSLLL